MGASDWKGGGTMCPGWANHRSQNHATSTHSAIKPRHCVDSMLVENTPSPTQVYLCVTIG